jgi:hypothetical protein
MPILLIQEKGIMMKKLNRFLIVLSILAFIVSPVFSASTIYNSFKQKIMDGSIDLDTDEIRVILVTSSYSPNIDSHEDYADITNEVSGAGYDAGGKALTSLSVTKDTGDDEGVFTADPISWTASTITARGAIVLKWTGTPGTSWLVCYIDFGEDKISSSGTFTITWDAEGIVVIQ